MRINMRALVRAAAAGISSSMAGACLLAPDQGLPNTASVQQITPQEAYDLIQQRQGDPSFAIVDVRMPEEFADGYIAGAVNICIERCNSSFNDEIAGLDRTATYLVYCRSGRRSNDAAAIMVGLGFTYVYNMSGGINQWQADRLPVVTSE